MPNLALTGDHLVAAMITERSLPRLVEALNIPKEAEEGIRENFPKKLGEYFDFIVVDSSQSPVYWITMSGSLFHSYYRAADKQVGTYLTKVVSRIVQSD